MTLTTMKYFITKAKAATNLVTNPKFETGTTGWATSGTNTIAQSSEQQRRGAYSCKCTYQNDAFLAGFTVALTATNYVYSMDVYIPSDYNGTNLQIGFRFFTGAIVAFTSLDMTMKDKWQRVQTTALINAADISGQVAIFESGTAPTAGRYIYIDGAQVELGSVATTFIDGDKVEVINGISQYGWNGTPNASTSYRRGTTRSGGELIDIEDYMIVNGIIGLGDTNRKLMKLPTANGYSIHQETRKSDREFILTGEVYGTAYGSWMEKRNQLISLLKPDAALGDQPLIIRYQGYDENGAIATEPVDIKCRFVGGLGGEWKRPTNERISLIFESDDDIQKAADNGVALGYQTAISNANYIIKRDSAGVWSALGSGMNNNVNIILQNKKNGLIYVAGDFTTANAVTVNKICYWNGTTFVALGTGANADINTMFFDASGNLYVGGEFTSIGGVAANRIAKWDGTNWSALGSGMNNPVDNIVIDTGGILYASGKFTTAGGGAALYIAKWNGSAWSTVGSGADNVVGRLAIDKNNILYALGDFTTAAGTSNAAYIAKWNGSAWSALGSGLNNFGTDLAIDNKNNLYVSGLFTTAGGVTANYIAKWNGKNWKSINNSLDALIWRIYTRDGNEIYVSGVFTEINGYTLPDSILKYSGACFFPLDADLPTTPPTYYVRSIFETDNGELYLGYNASGTAYSATVTTPTVVGTRTYPKVKAIGPGTLWQIKNYTNNIAVYFNGLTLLSGETVTIDFEKGTINSTFRGNCMNYLLDGSSLNLNLEPGTNNISGYMTGTDANSKLTMTWKTRYNSLDEVTL